MKDSCVAEDSFAVSNLEVTYKYYYSRHWESVTGDNFRNLMTTDDISNLVSEDTDLQTYPRCPKTCSVSSIVDSDGADMTSSTDFEYTNFNSATGSYDFEWLEAGESTFINTAIYPYTLTFTVTCALDRDENAGSVTIT